MSSGNCYAICGDCGKHWAAIYFGTLTTKFNCPYCGSGHSQKMLISGGSPERPAWYEGPEAVWFKPKDETGCYLYSGEENLRFESGKFHQPAKKKWWEFWK